MASQPKLNTVQKARTRLLLTQPFFATLLLRTPTRMSDEVEYAACDGEQILLNPDFADKCEVKEMQAVLCHEIAHKFLFHHDRLQGRDPEDFNRAADHAINLMLEELDLLCAPKALPGGWLADAQYKGMTAEQIYDRLRKDKQSGGGSGQDQPGRGRRKGAPPPMNDALHGDLRPRPGNDERRVKAKQRALQDVAMAANIARMAGKFGGALARMVGDILDTKTPWDELVREFLVAQAKVSDDWSRRNRRYPGVYLPALGGRRFGELVVIGDTSGSMGDEELRMLCSEINSAAEILKPERIRVLWADTKVRSMQVFEAGEFEYEALKPEGGGGTDMRVPLDAAAEFDPIVVVLCSDGHTPWPAVPPEFPLITLCWTDVAIPYGTVARI